MDVAAVMDELAAELDTIAELRVYAYPQERVDFPAAIIDWPETIEYDTTYGRGTDRMTVPVLLLWPRSNVREARTQLSAFASGTGAKSVKAVIEDRSRNGTWTEFDDAQVASAEFDPATWGGVPVMVALFTIRIIGPGSGG